MPVTETAKVRIKDVATHAEVSVTTVSHVLNDVPGKRISDETRERVRRAAAELGYTPNGLARNFRFQRTQTVALVSDVIATTPYAGGIILGAQEAASQRGWLLILVNTGGDKDREAVEIAALRQRQVDGFIYATMYHRDVSVPDGLVNVPTVLVDSYTSDPSISWVIPDDFTGGRTATEELLRHGHREIGFVTNVDDIPATRSRLEGFRAALHDAGLEPRDSWIVSETSDTQGGFRAAMKVLGSEHRPTALFCFNDRMAMGAYQAAAELGLRVPEDLSVVGYDNQELISAGLRPTLTTVALPHYEMGRWAVETLIRQIEQPTKGAPQQVRLPCPLVSRESVSQPP